MTPTQTRIRQNAPIIAILLVVALVQPPARGDDPHVTVTPGTPNVWSMEQAHYLLNRLRANKDGLQSKRPTEDELDPNAINGIRLDAIQSFLGVGAEFNQLQGTQNRLQLDEYQTSTARRRALASLADAKRLELQNKQLASIRVKQQTALLTAQMDETTDPEKKQALKDRITTAKAESDALDAEADKLSTQVTDLVSAAGQQAATPAADGSKPQSNGSASGTGKDAGSDSSSNGSGVPSLSAPDAAYPDKISGMMTDAFKTLINSTASKFGQPRLHATQYLDNFVQMQYEIIAKQLTTLRDEVGRGQRVIFLELPTAISAGAERKLWFTHGGENRLAQSWWKIDRVHLAYDRQNSPCWIEGDDVYQGIQSQLLGKEGEGHNVDEVPRIRRTVDAAIANDMKKATAIEQTLKSAKQGATDEQAMLRREKEDRDSAAVPVDGERIEKRLLKLDGIRRNLNGDGDIRTRLQEFIEARFADLRDLTDQLRKARDTAASKEKLYDDARRQNAAARAERQHVLTMTSDLLRLSIPQQRARPGSDESYRAFNEFMSNFKPEQPGVTEDSARREWDASLAVVNDLKAEALQIEAELLGLGITQEAEFDSHLDFFNVKTKATISRLEQPCRAAQVEFAELERRDSEQRDRLFKLKKSISSVGQQLAVDAGNTAALRSQRTRFAHDMDALVSVRTEHEQKARELKRQIAAAETVSPRPEKKIQRLTQARAVEESAVRDLSEQVNTTSSLVTTLDQQISDAETETKRLRGMEQEAGKVQSELDDLDRLRAKRSEQLRDRLEELQTAIYVQFGGPSKINGAYVIDVRQPMPWPRCQKDSENPNCINDTGLVRALEVLPRQTALNVNQTHALVNHSAASVAMKYLIGFGAKVDYERMREKYDQFVQQEVFASGFGKGSTEFGWTFGPMPGTKVLNDGTRTTYAALTVPSTATAIEMSSAGCAFHHNQTGPRTFPEVRDDHATSNRSEADMNGVECVYQNTVRLGLPDRESSGSFFVREVRYAKVKPGERATIVLHGQFSPEITVLANGKRLTQLVGLGKPQIPMDSGPLEDSVDGVISGYYEYVNDGNVAITLAIPADYKSSDFPSLTIISPSRTATINDIPLVVNGHPAVKLKEEALLVQTREPFALKSIEMLTDAPDDGYVSARVTGTRLLQMERLWIGSQQLNEITPVSDSLALIRFNPPPNQKWEFTAVSRPAQENDAETRTSSSVSIPNPLRQIISSVSVRSSSVKYDDDGNPVSAEVIVTGTGFTPALKLSANPASSAVIANSTYVSATQWNARITNIGKVRPEFQFSGPGGIHFGSTVLDIPPKPDDSPAAAEGKTTITRIEKKVTREENADEQ